MPSNIAHLLICHKTMNKLREQNNPQITEFINILENSNEGKNLKPYLNLGSLGPDLFYYQSMVGGVKGLLFENHSKARGVEPWSYHLHSIRPNEFPLKLIEIIFRDVKKEKDKIVLEFEDYARLAFVAGYLTHLAADQIIHPIVNQYAGPYYRSGDNRIKHRTCEVYQDYYLYTVIYQNEGKTGDKYNFLEQNFNEWIDCIKGLSTKNTEDWFRYFIQRGFAETYNIFPDEDIIEDSVDNLLLALRTCTTIGPYKEAAKDYSENGINSAMYKEYIEKLGYLSFYEQALELSCYYIKALYETFILLGENKAFSDEKQESFKKIVSDADLTCPLDNSISKFVKNHFNSNE